MVMSVDKIKSSSYKNVSFTDISARVKSIFSAINYGANGYVAYRKDARGLHIIDFQFYANSAIGSGSGTLSGYIDELPYQTEVPMHCSLTSNDGKTGWVQLNSDGTLYIRCQASDSYLCGQMVY